MDRLLKRSWIGWVGYFLLLMMVCQLAPAFDDYFMTYLPVRVFLYFSVICGVLIIMLNIYGIVKGNKYNLKMEKEYMVWMSIYCAISIACIILILREPVIIVQ